MKLLAAILCSIGLLASSPELALAADDPVAEARVAIEAANAKFSEVFSRGDENALAALYTTDATLLPPGETLVTGSAAIGEYWKKSHDSGVVSAKLTTTTVERSGDVAIETGQVELKIRAEGKPEATANAKYLVVWNRQADGVWKMHRDIWNELPAGK